MKLKFFTGIILMSFLFGCSHKSTISQYELPIVVNKDPAKEGRACSKTFMIPPIIIPINFGSDLTVESARKDGDIKEIISIEREVSPGFFYIKECMIVKGN